VFADIAPLKREAWLRGLAGYDDGGGGGSAGATAPAPAAAASPHTSGTAPPTAAGGTAALLIPTHKWSPRLQAGLAPLVSSATAAGLRVYVLRMPRLSDAQLGRPAHIRSGDDDGAGNGDVWSSPTLPGVTVLPVAAGALASLYASGYISPWVNTHHALLWFWRTHGRAAGLARVWVVEGDVRAVGDAGALWRHSPAADFVSTTPITPLPADHWATWQWRGPKPARPPVIAFKQVYAASARYLDFLDARCAGGRNGQDEALLATSAVELGGAVADLAQFLDASWSWDPRLAAAARDAWVNATAAATATGGGGALRLFHPVKR
jgi:hypothetical protein